MLPCCCQQHYCMSIIWTCAYKHVSFEDPAFSSLAYVPGSRMTGVHANSVFDLLLRSPNTAFPQILILFLFQASARVKGPQVFRSLAPICFLSIDRFKFGMMSGTPDCLRVGGCSWLSTRNHLIPGSCVRPFESPPWLFLFCSNCHRVEFLVLFPLLLL